MNSALSDLLRNTSDRDEDSPTHLTFYGPHRQWGVKSSDLVTFWENYCQLVANSSPDLCLAELPTKYMPVIGKFCLQFENIGISSSYDVYDDDFILAVVRCFQIALSELFTIGDGEEASEIICCVLGPDDGRTDPESNYYELRFRVHFPFAQIERSLQTNILRPRVIQLLRRENVISRLTYEPVNKWETIYSPSSAEEPCLMYMSVPDPRLEPLTLSHIYGTITKEHIEDGSDRPELELENVFYPVNHSDVQTGMIPASLFSENSDVYFWLPMFLSIKYWTRYTLPKTQPTGIGGANPMRASGTDRSRINRTISDEDDIDRADRFLTMLGRNRVEKDHYWMDVGRALYTVTSAEKTGLDLWIQFTEQSDNHDAEDCSVLYEKFNVNNTETLKTLAWYARQDSPECYNRWHKEWCLTVMEKAAETRLHTDVARAFYQIYWLEFICSSTEKMGSWYHFRGHVWCKVDNAVSIKKTISGDFDHKFEEWRTSISHQAQESGNANFKKSTDNTIDDIQNLRRKIKTQHYKNSLTKELCEFFHQENFSSLANSKYWLVGMNNGIIESGDDIAVLRPGKPEDYVTRTSGISYPINYTWGHPRVKELLEWFRKVYPDPELLEYVSKIFASCIHGRNSDRLFPAHTGIGGNSKSMIKKLFEAAFGGYSITFPTTVFTGKQDTSGAPMPQIAQAMGALVAWVQEPRRGLPFNEDFIKTVTGGDSFFARKCHKNGGKMEASFKLFLLCNGVPKMLKDKAMNDRVHLIPYLSLWDSEHPESIEEQEAKHHYKPDPFFEKRIPYLAQAFWFYLVQKYADYKRDGVSVTPRIVKKHTKKYWEKHDIYASFTRDCIGPVFLPDTDPARIDINARVTINDVYMEFKKWHRDNYPNNKTAMPDKNEFTSEIITRWGKPERGSWGGIHIINLGGDVNFLFDN